MIDAVNSTAEIWFRYLSSASFQATLLALVVMAMVFVGRRWSPATRYALLLVALIKFAVPPTLHSPTGFFSYFDSNRTSRPIPAITHVPPLVQEALWPPERSQVEPLSSPVEAPPERSAHRAIPTVRTGSVFSPKSHAITYVQDMAPDRPFDRRMCSFPKAASAKGPYAPADIGGRARSRAWAG